MKKNLLLYGEIGCGKSTLIRNALGKDICAGGGYVTLRITEDGRLSGFDLAPAAALWDPDVRNSGRRFLDFTKKKKEDFSVFSDLGTELLREALQSPYAVADEFGGTELLVPEFQQALMNLLKSPVPCIGVVKTERASKVLMGHLSLGDSYRKAYEALIKALRSDPNTELLETTGRYDEDTKEKVDLWVRQYVRK